MKLDYDLIKEILEHVQENDTGFTEHILALKNFENSDEGKKQFIAQVYHYNILIENGFIDGRSVIHDNFSFNAPTAAIFYKDLTLTGQQVLEGMRDEETSNKIKDALVKSGKEGLRQAPSLAIGVIMKFLGL